MFTHVANDVGAACRPLLGQATITRALIRVMLWCSWYVQPCLLAVVSGASTLLGPGVTKGMLHPLHHMAGRVGSRHVQAAWK